MQKTEQAKRRREAKKALSRAIARLEDSRPAVALAWTLVAAGHLEAAHGSDLRKQMKQLEKSTRDG